MALSTNTYTYTGGAQTFAVNFALGFIQRSDVKVRVNNAVDGAGDPAYTAFEWIDDSNISVTPTLTISDSVEVLRTVSKTELKVDFTAGADVTPSNLDLSAKHGLMVYQELVDGRVEGTESPIVAANRAETAAIAAEASEVSAAADLLLTDADTVATAADRAAVAADLLLTAADTVATAADRVQTGLDATATAADLVQTDLDTIATAADVIAASDSELEANDWATRPENSLTRTFLNGVGTNRAAGNYSALHWDAKTAADAISTAADRAAVAADLLLTDADTVATDADRSAVAADLVQTNIDQLAVAADAAQVAIDKAAVAADLVLTAADTVATAADRVVTTQDALDTAADVLLTNADVVTAAASAAAAAASYDSFDDRYLGAKASAPTLDNDGDALLVGAMYWNTTGSQPYVYTGSTWAGAVFNTAGAMFGANNLSDVANAATARTNLGVVIGADVQAFDADTLKADTTDNLTAAFTASVDDDGTKSSGTYTPTTAAGSKYKKVINGGAITVAPPALATNTATTLSLFIVNNASAGAITTSGFTKVTGDDFTTTNGHEFMCRIEVFDIGGTEFSMLNVVAMQ